MRGRIKNFRKEEVLTSALVLGFVVSAVFAIYFAVFFTPWGILSVGGMLQPNPLEPEIRSGEFPLSLAYKMNGKIIEIEDALIVKYTGIVWDAGNGKYRSWEEHFKVRGDRAVIFRAENVPAFDDTNGLRTAVLQELYFEPGWGGYYMGDALNEEDRWYDEVAKNFPEIRLVEFYADGNTYSDQFSSEELKKYFDIELLAWYHAPPIVNAFE